MEGPFFSIADTPNTLGKAKLEDGHFTEDIEDVYDALNDETFGLGADDGDWEEGHNKFATAVVRERDECFVASFLDNSVFENDDSQNEIISKSISQLGLEDDLDDPAIMTVGRTQNSWPIESSFRSSPPPPAIIDTEFCGSPNAQSIWSTNLSAARSKENTVSYLLKSIKSLKSTNPSVPPVSRVPVSSPYQRSPLPLSPYPSDAFTNALDSKAWTVEEIERNFLTSSGSESHRNNWSTSPSCHVDKRSSPVVDKSYENDTNEHASPFMNDFIRFGVRTLDDVEKDILLKSNCPTVDTIENLMQTNSEISGNKNVLVGHDSPISLKPKQALHSLSSATHAAQDLGPFHSSPVPAPIRLNINDTNMKNRLSGPGPCVGMSPNLVFHKRFGVPFRVSGHRTVKDIDERFNNFYPRPRPLFLPTSVLDPRTMNLSVLPRRTIHHPLLHNGLPGVLWPQQMDPNFMQYGNANSSGYYEMDRPYPHGSDDDYSNLMTQKEKEWLTRINLMLTNPENPYVEDYYHSTLLLRKCTQRARKNDKTKEGPKMLLPEKSKMETKTYVPAQFEGSLGKLQAVSVNYPRRVLDITVSRPLEDDDGHIVTNQSLSKYRQLLIDIEKLYNCLLEVDDESKRVLALPDDAQMPHKANISTLIEKIFVGLGCENIADEDTFMNIMTVRKGRHLGMRAFEVFSSNQKLFYLVALFKCFAAVLRKDQNDFVLLGYADSIIDFIRKAELCELVELGESLENLPQSETIIVPYPIREKSNFISAFKNKLGSSIVCSLLEQAESNYARNKVLDSESQTRWAKVVLHIVDILCTLPDSSISPPFEAQGILLTHFQRFAIDRDKFEVLKEKVKIFELCL